MNILFLTLTDFNSINDHNIYADLLREFCKKGNEVYIVSPNERRKRMETFIVREKNASILKVKIGNIQKTNILEKGISTLLVEYQMISAIKKYFSEVKFDLVMYSTPPITFYKAINYVKKRDNASTYLLLKDIFPQNAIDIGILSTTGIKGIIYRFFRKKEKNLYKISDVIGCMSQANVDYVLKHNPEVNPEKVEICPNCIEPIDKSVNEETRKLIREKYGIPLNKTVFVYGGNLGKPQGIPFLIDCLKSQKNNFKVFFLIVGDGTEYGTIESYIKNEKPENVLLMRSLPKEDYDSMVGACDVGMIFLDYRFTIPNFPSRLLSYLQAKIPVFAITDSYTDIGNVLIENDLGWWSESDNLADFEEGVFQIESSRLMINPNKLYDFLVENYSVERAYSTIINMGERNSGLK